MAIKKTLFTDVSKLSAEDLLQHEIHSSALFMHIVKSIDQYFEQNTVTEHMAPYIKSNLFVNLTGQFFYDYTQDDLLCWIKQLLKSLRINSEILKDSGEKEESPKKLTALEEEKVKAGIVMIGKNFADLLLEEGPKLEMSADAFKTLCRGVIGYMNSTIEGTISDEIKAYQESLQEFMESLNNNSTSH
jgi:hypothetical protein